MDLRCHKIWFLQLKFFYLWKIELCLCLSYAPLNLREDLVHLLFGILVRASIGTITEHLNPLDYRVGALYPEPFKPFAFFFLLHVVRNRIFYCVQVVNPYVEVVFLDFLRIYCIIITLHGLHGRVASSLVVYEKHTPARGL